MKKTIFEKVKPKKQGFYFRNIKIDVAIKDKSMRMIFSGDIKKEFIFKSPHKLNEGIALLTAHICSIPFQIQAKRCTVITPLGHRRMERLVDIFKANMATYISLYPDYPNEIHATRIRRKAYDLVLKSVHNTAVPVIPKSAALAVSAGKESLLGAYLLRDVPTEFYTVNNPNFMTTALLKCPLAITRAPVFAPHGWRQEYNMTLPWRLFTLAAAADRAEVLFFGDEFETNQAMSLSKKKSKDLYHFFSDDFDQSVFISGLINWAVQDFTKTKMASLVPNLCELQIQGILDSVQGSKEQISCWCDTRWCDDCSKCRRFSLMFEALRGTSEPLTPLSKKTLALMNPTQMWSYCHPLQKRWGYLQTAAYAPGRDSLEILRNIIYLRRGYSKQLVDVSTDFLAQRIASKVMPIVPTPFDAWIDKELLRFKGVIDGRLLGNR